MNCIKCGRETANEQIFCQECLAEMEKYPVKPNTYVRLPERRDPPRRLLKRRAVNTDEQIRVLKLRSRNLTIGLLLSLLLLAGMTYYFIGHLRQDHAKPGQNYSVVTPTAKEAMEENEA